MPFTFKEFKDNIEFEYCADLPKMVRILKERGWSIYGRPGSLNLFALHIYGLYRNALYDSYFSKKSDLPQGILERQLEYKESKASLQKDPVQKEPLYHYTVATAVGAVKEWRNPADNMKGFIGDEFADGLGYKAPVGRQMRGFLAYENVDCRRTLVGFVDFNERLVRERDAERMKKVVYISTMAVSRPGHKIGRRLMECVLAHHDPETEFYVLTRKFNTEANALYGKTLGFPRIEAPYEHEIELLGYDPKRYNGFQRKTTHEELAAINAKREPIKSPVRLKFSRERVAKELEALEAQKKEARLKQHKKIKLGFFAGTALAAGVVCLKILKSQLTSAKGKTFNA